MVTRHLHGHSDNALNKQHNLPPPQAHSQIQRIQREVGCPQGHYIVFSDFSFCMEI